MFFHLVRDGGRNLSDSVNYKIVRISGNCTPVRPYTLVEGQISTSPFCRIMREKSWLRVDVTGCVAKDMGRCCLITSTTAVPDNHLESI